MESVPGSTYTQTSGWADLKTRVGWQPHRLAIRKDGHIVAGAQLLSRKPIPLVQVASIQGGPLVREGNEGHLEQLHEEIVAAMGRLGSSLIALQAPYRADATTQALQAHGWQVDQHTTFKASTLVIDLQSDVERLLTRMKKQVRKNIRKAADRGIQVRVGDTSDLAFFHLSLRRTADRRDFVPPDLDYFRAAWESLRWGDHSMQLFIAEYEGKPVSSLLVIAYGDTVTTWRCGWSGEEPKRYPNEAMEWYAIQWAKTHGYRYYDFEGLDPRAARAVVNAETMPDDLVQSAATFKLGFGGDVRLNQPTLYLVSNRVLGMVYTRVRPMVQSRDVRALLEGQLLAGLRPGKVRSTASE